MQRATASILEDGTATALAPGVVIGGRYRLTRVAGSGGMGAVWEATNTWTERRVAVKVMHEADPAGGVTTAAPERVERFLREAKATARVRHPHVVDVLDMGNDPERGGLFIVYEFLDGESLRALFERRGPLPPDEALALLTPAMEGVAEAHRCGVVHRDLKPENILLARDPAGRVTPRVIDFGIARTDASEPALTGTGEAIGTARYMSPEQCRGATDVDARADVWAFGVILFEALTGRAPFEGDGYHQVLAAVLTTDAPPLRARRPDVPARVAAAVDRCLARDRDARHPSMRALLDALGEPAAPTTAAPRAATAPRPTARAALGVALLAALSGAAWLAARRPTARRTPAPAALPDAGASLAASAVPAPAGAPPPAVAAPPPRPAPPPVLVAARPTLAPPRPRRPPVVVPAAPRAIAAAQPPVTPRPAPLPNGAPVLEP